MKVSIITPSFNQGKFIGRTLQSVAQQKHNLPASIVLEHIIYDGGSTDETIDVLMNFGAETSQTLTTKKVNNGFYQDANYHLSWVTEHDKGQTHAVNKGLQNTSGEIIGWLNSDDIYYPGAIAKVVNFFTDNPHVDVVYGMAKHIDISDKDIDFYPTTDFSVQALLTNCFICQPALFFRRRILATTGFLDEELQYCMDYEFWIRMALLGIKFTYLKELLAGSRLYPQNKTLSAKVAVHAEINDMLKKHLNYVPTGALINYAYAVVSKNTKKNINPIKFAYKLFFTSLQASKKWNGEVFGFLQKASRHWFCALLQGRFKSWRKI